MRRVTLTTSSLALLAAVLMVLATAARGKDAWTAETIAGADVALATAIAPVLQDEPPLTLTPLASGEIGRLPNEPLRWVVREFRQPAGYTSALLTHPPAVYYVLDGVISFTQEGVTVSLGPGGGSFARGTDHVHATAGNVPHRILGFYVYPARLPTPGDSATSMILFESEPMEGLGDGPYTLALSLVETRQGVIVPTHFHSGPTLGYVLEGGIEQTLGGVATTRRAGDAWLEQPGVISAGRFSGRTAIRILVAQVLPQGDPPLIPVD